MTGYDLDSLGDITNTHTQAVQVTGFRLVDGRASYGFGLESFLLGFPMHFDWSWKTLLNKAYEDVINPTCTQVTATSVDLHGRRQRLPEAAIRLLDRYDF